jgi:hypothetical protein
MENTSGTAIMDKPPETTVQPPVANDAASSVKADTKASVKSYQDEVWISSWKRRSAGLWAGTLCGAGYGAAIGTLACLSTVFVGMTGGAALALLPVVVPAMTVVGIGSGIAVFTAVGAPSGAVAHGLKEQDKRWEDSGLIDESKKEEKEKGKKFFNWKIAAAGFVMAGLVGAAFIASGGLGGLFAPAIIPSISTAINTAIAMPGVTASAAAVTNCLIISVFGLFGAQFGFDGPSISLKATNLMGKFISGKIFETEKESVSPVQNIQPLLEKHVTNQLTRPSIQERATEERQQPTNVITPEGVYAGKEAGFHVRKLAEQQFKMMEPGAATRH